MLILFLNIFLTVLRGSHKLPAFMLCICDLSAALDFGLILPGATIVKHLTFSRLSWRQRKLVIRQLSDNLSINLRFAGRGLLCDRNLQICPSILLHAKRKDGHRSVLRPVLVDSGAGHKSTCSCLVNLPGPTPVRAVDLGVRASVKGLLLSLGAN